MEGPKRKKGRGKAQRIGEARDVQEKSKCIHIKYHLFPIGYQEQPGRRHESLECACQILPALHALARLVSFTVHTVVTTFTFIFNC